MTGVQTCALPIFSTTATDPRPSCVANPCLYGIPSGVGITSDCPGTRTDGLCNASCDQGYNGANQSYTCGALGEFNGSLPACQAKNCSSLSLGQEFTTAQCVGKVTTETCIVDLQKDGPVPAMLRPSPATQMGLSRAFRQPVFPTNVQKVHLQMLT